MTSIYTRTGDHGETSMGDGQRLPKDDLRIEANGNLDELSSILGVIGALLKKRHKRFTPAKNFFMPQEELIVWLQDKLFTVSSMIAMGAVNTTQMPILQAEDIQFLERHIDAMEEDLPPLTHFILPGGSELVSFIHLARTVCRRAERICTTYDRQVPLNPVILPFLNRLSDELFVLARWVGYQLGETEKIWHGRQHPDTGSDRATLRKDLAEKLLNEKEGVEQLTLFNPSDSQTA